jgi:hypothetical protein
MWVKCKSCVVYYIVIHIRVQYRSFIYCGSNYVVNSSLVYVYNILHFARDRHSVHTTICGFHDLTYTSSNTTWKRLSAQIICLSVRNRFRRACHWLFEEQTVIMWSACVG